MNGVQARIARYAIGISMRDLAKETGVATNTISRLENGEGDASGATLNALERFYLTRGIAFTADLETVSVTLPRDMRPEKSGRAANPVKASA